jgi:hypothetical protein
MFGVGLMIVPEDGQTMVQVTTSQLMMHIVKARALSGKHAKIIQNKFIHVGLFLMCCSETLFE